MQPIRFVLGREDAELTRIDPTMTVLNYLRTVARRTGTKEGCAEGDCGACTVVVGTLAGERVAYRAVNSCLLFVATLDGKQLITVEDLRLPDGTLHPVQQAMVDCHGSQCGFCTPGFVMSLFAAYHSEPRPSRQRINDVLAGNLCRCTGYAPIVAAAEAMYGWGGHAVDDAFTREEAATVERLRRLRRNDALQVTYDGHTFYAPTTIADLADLVARHPEAHLLSGGTDLGLLVTKQHRDLETVIYLGNVEELRTVAVAADGTISVGATAPLSDAERVISGRYRDFGELLRRFGSLPVRNTGTLGGNLATASPIGDTLPALLVLDAAIRLRRGETRRRLRLGQFVTGYRQTALQPGEFIEGIDIPAQPDRRFAAYKVAKRFDQDISSVCAAFSVAFDGDVVRDARVAYGGMGPTAARAASCEAALAGRPWTEDAVAAAVTALANDFTPITDLRASARYRTLVAGNLLRRFYLETTGAVATRVLDYAGAFA